MTFREITACHPRYEKTILSDLHLYTILNQVLDGADCMVQSGMDASLRDIFDQAPACKLLS